MQSEKPKDIITQVNSISKKSNERMNAAQEGREFLSLGEPVKVGHHSEHRHRALIERNNNRMDKAMEHLSKAEEQERKSGILGK